MKPTILLIISCLLISAARASDRWETLEAIHWVENPTASTKPGPKGELGPYQFMRKTWQMHTKQPFHLANDRKIADQIAVAHYEWIRQGLVRNGLDASPYNIAMAWNAGLGAVVQGKIPSQTRNYAERVVNLVEDLKARQIASAR